MSPLFDVTSLHLPLLLRPLFILTVLLVRGHRGTPSLAQTLLKVTRVDTITIKIPRMFFQYRKILKFMWNLKGPQTAKTILNKSRAGGSHVS